MKSGVGVSVEYGGLTPFSTTGVQVLTIKSRALGQASGWVLN